MRILIIDDSRYDGLVLRRELLKGCPEIVVSHFVSLDQGVWELTHTGYDAAIISLSLLAQQPAATSRFLEVLERHVISPALVLIKSTSDLEGLAQLVIAGSSRKVQVLGIEQSWHKLVPDIVARITADSTPKVRSATIEIPSQPTVNPLGSPAHEINNPLMTILGTTELILGKSDLETEDIHRKLKIIRRSAYRIKHYLDQPETDGGQQGLPVRSTISLTSQKTLSD